ncbi:MAG: efflux RND transporter permease subunit [Candidatus Absconditabacterales bacterium]
MIHFLQKNKISILILALFLGIYGALSVFTITKEAQPSVNIPYYNISLSYIGADPSTIEQQLVIPLEQKIKSINGIKHITSSSYYSFGTILVEFLPSKKDAEATNDLKTAIDQTYLNFPSDASNPIIRKININDTPVYGFSVASNIPSQSVYAKVKILEDKIKSLPGIGELTIIGKPIQEIKIVFDSDQLGTLDLDFSNIVSQLKNAFVKFPADKKDVSGKLYSFEITNYNSDITGLLNQLKNYDILNVQGKTIKLGNISQIYLSYKKQDKKSFVITDSKSLISENALSFQITKAPGYNLDTFIKSIKKEISDFSPSQTNLKFIETLSQSESIKRTYNLFMENFFETGALVFVIILIFLGSKSSFVILISFLLVYLTNFIYLKAIGYSFNNIVSFALILVLGIMVDNLIVITQGIVVGLQKFNNNIWHAITDSIHNYGRALIFGTSTTIAIFVPLYFGLSGIIGEYIRSMPVTIISNLAISLIVTLIILPVIASLFFRKGKEFHVQTSLSFLDKIGHKFATRYHRVNQTRWGSRRIIFFFFLFFIGALSLVPLGFVKFTFMGNIDSDNIRMNFKYPPGSSLQENQIYTSKISRESLSYLDKIYSGLVEYVAVDLGQQSSLQGGGLGGSHVSTLTIRLIKGVNRNVPSYKMVERLQKELVPVLQNEYPFLKDISIYTLQAGGGGGKPISFSIVGDDYSAINDYIQNILPEIKKIPGVYNVASSIEYTNGKIIYTLDQNKAKELGVNDMSSVMSLMALQNGNSTNNGIKIKDFVEFGDDPLSLNAFLSTNGEIDQIKIGKIPLNQLLITQKLQAEISSIQRLDGKKNISISADKENSVALSDITTKINSILKNHPFPLGLAYSSGGDIESQSQSTQDLGTAMIIGLLLMILILIIQFNNIKYSIVIVSSVFLSIGGTITILALTGYDLTFPAMIGIFGVLGVGVNQALIHLEDFKLYYERQGNSVVDSFKMSIAERFIPIFLTKITTIVGLLILAMKDELFGSMAIAFIGGLIVSFFITLLYIPSLMNLVSRKYYKHEEGIKRLEN